MTRKDEKESIGEARREGVGRKEAEKGERYSGGEGHRRRRI